MKFSVSSSKQESGKTEYQLLLISGLQNEIEMARKLDPEKFAAEIRKIGFSCQNCGKCCRRAFGDNRVALTPSEIGKIQVYTGFSKLEIAGPFIPEYPSLDETKNKKNSTESCFEASEEKEKTFYDSPEFLELLREDIDYEGNIHVFGWVLRRKKNGDCIFLERGTNKCKIYKVRPMLCRTYPFYIEELRLYTCECEGLGNSLSPEESRKLAEDLLFRYIYELEDTLAMYEKYVDFKKDEKGPELAKRNLEKGTAVYILHDSTGLSKILNNDH